MRDLTDYKYWICERAEEIAQERFGTDYDDLDSATQLGVFKEATADYTDAQASRADYLNDVAREQGQ